MNFELFIARNIRDHAWQSHNAIYSSGTSTLFQFYTKPGG